MGTGMMTGTVLSAIGMIGSSVESGLAQKEANKKMQEAININKENYANLQSLYGDFLENQSKYVQNLTGETFALPYIQELQVQSQRNLQAVQQNIQQAGLNGSGYAMQAESMNRQQEAEGIARATWQGEQQAMQMKQEESRFGRQLLESARSSTTNALMNHGQMQQSVANQARAQRDQYFSDMASFMTAGSNQKESGKDRGSDSTSMYAAGMIPPLF